MRYGILALPLSILAIVLVLVNSFKWQMETAYEFDERQMDIQVNYCIDGAIQEMLNETSHIGTDYADKGRIRVNPQIGYDTYIELLLKNLDWSKSNDNIALLESDMIPFFCVAMYDGYYMKIRQENIINFNNVKQASYDLVWTPKLPYTFTDIHNPNVKYAVNLAYKEPMRMDNSNIQLRYKGNDITEEQQRRAVVATLSDACNKALLTGFSGNIDKAFEIPPSMSKFRGTNGIEGVTILTYLAKDSGVSKYTNNVFGIGGARINDANFCIAYERNGRKYYCKPYYRNRIEEAGINITGVFTSDKEAAKAGYYYDFEIAR